MTPAEFIRKKVFGVRSQTKFGELLGYSQVQVWRWETGGEPISRAAQERIRAKARELGLEWNDSWFFEVPPVEAEKVA